MEQEKSAPHYLHRRAGNGPRSQSARQALVIHRVFITFFLDGELEDGGRTGSINGHAVEFTHH